MRMRWIAAGIVTLACLTIPAEQAEARRFFHFMENKGHNIHHIGPRLPFATTNSGWYDTRYPFNRYYTIPAHSYYGYHEYNR
jgi:hypothetical protein